jgi:LuxR family transcriptional regulator, maltose regulon positive regulatory protein
MVVARHWFRYVFAGQTATVEGWLEVLPEDLVNSYGPLLLVKAWISALYGRWEDRERFLALAEGSSYEGRLPDGSASVEASVALIRAVFAYGSVQSIGEAARRAAELEPAQTSPRAALVRLGLGHGFYLSGDASRARKLLEEALALTKAGQPLVRIAVLFALSSVALDEGNLKEAESLALELRALVDRFQLYRLPQSSLAPIAFGRVLAERGKLDEAQKELAQGLSVRRAFPSLSPWATLLGLLALASVRYTCGDRVEARDVLAEARSILDAFPDGGIFPEILERQERKLRRIKRRDGSLDGEITEREFDVLGLLLGDLSTRQMADSLYVAPSTVRTQVKSIYRKLGVSSRKDAIEEARLRGLIQHPPHNP